MIARVWLHHEVETKKKPLNFTNFTTPKKKLRLRIFRNFYFVLKSSKIFFDIINYIIRVVSYKAPRAISISHKFGALHFSLFILFAAEKPKLRIYESFLQS